MKTAQTANTLEEARVIAADFEGFVGASAGVSGEGFVTLGFVKYRPGAKSGKFHEYHELRVSRTVYEELRKEL